MLEGFENVFEHNQFYGNLGRGLFMRNYILTIALSFSLLFAPVMANVGCADAVDPLCVAELQLACMDGFMAAGISLDTAVQTAFINAVADQFDRLNECDGDPLCIATVNLSYYAQIAEIWAYKTLAQGVLSAAYEICLAGAYAACWILGS